MAGATLGLRSGGIALALLVSAAIVPAEVAAADPEVKVFPGSTISAVNADLDGDGSAEVVRLLHQPGTGAVAEAWKHDEGDWVPVGSELLLPETPGAGFEDRQLASLVGLRTDGRQLVLAVSAEIEMTEASAATCCMELFELRLGDAGIALLPVSGGPTAADFLQALDMDGDGTDELVTHLATYGPEFEAGTFVVEVRRWEEDGLETIFRLERQEGFGVVTGDSDGMPGSELLLAPTVNGDIVRATMIDGRVEVEEGHLDLGERSEGIVAGVADGRIVLMHPEGARVARWPRGGRPREVARLESHVFPSIAVVGDGADALIVAYDEFQPVPGATPAADVYDLDLRPLGTVEGSAGIDPFHELMRRTASGIGFERSVFPYAGPFPGGGSRGGAAYVANGILIEPAGIGEFETARVAPMLGTAPLGRAGPDDAWMVLLDNRFYSMLGAYLIPYYGAISSAGGRLAVVPVDQLLRPEISEVVAIELDGGVETARDAGEATIVAGPDGFQATVDGPAGTIVMVIHGATVDEREIVDGPVTFEVHPRRNGREDRNQEFDRLLLIMSPDGRGEALLWQGTFVRVPPELVVNGETNGFSLRSTVSGRASEGSTVTVDGRPPDMNAYGAFRLEVDAPIWPRDVIVVARDPVGNETVARLQVVGLLDYRGLPWLPIMGLATVGAAVFLFLRTPRRRAEPSVGWGDATLEEIDGD